MVNASDPTVRGGASNPYTLKKVLRANQIGKVLRFMVNGCRNNRGVIRASLKQSAARPEEWLPHQRNGEDIVDRLVALLVPRLPGSAEDAELRVRFAMQMVFGSLVNAVLNNPGPLPLDDERLAEEMTRMVTCYLGLDA